MALLDWNRGLVKHLGIRFVETGKDRAWRRAGTP
jgi:hypothetical protein